MTTLLLVDDEADIRETMAALLGHVMPQVRLELAANGEEALLTLGRQSVDLVLTDYKMPAMDGATLILEIRKRWPGLPTMMFTAFMDAGMLAEVHSRVPGLKIIPKPLDVDFLVGQLREALPAVQA